MKLQPGTPLIAGLLHTTFHILVIHHTQRHLFQHSDALGRWNAVPCQSQDCRALCVGIGFTLIRREIGLYFIGQMRQHSLS